VKLILDEAGSADTREVFEAASLIQSSWLLVPESHAALARATLNRRFAPGGAARALAVLRDLLGDVEALDLDRELAERAAELAVGLGLRGSDAVHLASYEQIESEESVFVAADGALSRAALELGYAVAVPRA
jgi:predicted nucleic acid-binding protein